MEKWIVGIMTLLLLMAAVEDMREKKIHRWLLGLMLAVGVMGGGYACIGQSSNVWQFAGGLMIGLCMVGFSLISGGQIGMADGVIIAALGMLGGVRDCVVIIGIASMLMAAVSIVILIIRRGDRHTRLPFVPALLAGFCIAGWVL